jgi:hypothetical protein
MKMKAQRDHQNVEDTPRFQQSHAQHLTKPTRQGVELQSPCATAHRDQHKNQLPANMLPNNRMPWTRSSPAQSSASN